jgi:hypothetical protein
MVALRVGLVPTKVSAGAIWLGARLLKDGALPLTRL